MRLRHPENAPGDWYVDTSCTNCGAAQTVAPGLIVERDRQSVFARQPRTEEELRQAWRARILCPSASVRADHHAKPVAGIFPEAMADGVFRLGYNAAASFGAHSFALRCEAGTFMVDSPRWTGAVVDQLSAWGGLAGVLLTHQDDVGDAKRYADHFHAPVWIHQDDRAAAPFATNMIVGTEPIAAAPDLLAIPVPGHTRGSVCYLWKRYLFTGDSFAWDFADGELIAYRSYCWSWSSLGKSLARLLDHDFEWVFPGHGGSYHLPAADMRSHLVSLLDRMKTE